MKTLFKILLLLFWIGQSCSRQELVPVSINTATDFSILKVKAVYDDELSAINASVRKGKSKKEKTIKKRIDWSKSYYKTLGTKRRLIIPFNLEEEIFTRLADSSLVSYSKSTWLVASEEKGKVNFEVVTLLPDMKSLQNTNGKFSGHVIVENLAGDFVGGYVKSESARTLLTQNRENQRTTNYCVYFDWYTCVFVGGMSMGCYYDYSLTYCQVDDDDRGSFGGMSLGWGTDNYWREDMGSSATPDYSTTTNNTDPGVEYQIETDRDRIDLRRYFNCFNNLSSNNATYKVRLCADLVNNDNPNELTRQLKPGHAFLIMTKTSDGHSVTQSIGFYPQKGKVSSLHQPTTSQVVDDGSTQHEYNAYIDFEVPNEVTFNVLMNMANSLGSSMQYDLDNFNCTDFALQIINAAVNPGEQVHVSDWIGASSGINYGTTPNGLYKTIVEMQGQGKSNVGVGTWHAPTSRGPCD